MLIMTLLVRDEEDILPAHLDYHLGRGVDFFIVTDNRSVDGTGDILERYRRRGRLRVIREKDDDYAQGAWVTRMARLAAEEHGADWVMHSDADEFWWLPEGQSFPDFFDGLSLDAQGVHVARSNFVMTRPWDEQRPFYDQLEVRERQSLNMFGSPLPPKVCHRAHPGVEVYQGNHGYTLPGQASEHINNVSDPSFLIFHFPYRSFAHFENKIRLGGAAYERNRDLPASEGSTWRTLYDLWRRGGLEDFYRAQVLDPDALAEGLASGALIRDDRLRRHFDATGHGPAHDEP